MSIDITDQVQCAIDEGWSSLDLIIIDERACRAAATCEQACEEQRSGVALWLVLIFVAGLMLGMYALAGLAGAAIVAAIVVSLIGAASWESSLIEARKAGAIR